MVYHCVKRYPLFLSNADFCLLTVAEPRVNLSALPKHFNGSKLQTWAFRLLTLIIYYRSTTSVLMNRGPGRDIACCMIRWDPFTNKVTIWNPAQMNDYINSKMWDEITHPFQNVNDAAIDVWEWIDNFIPHFTWRVITYPYWENGSRLSMIRFNDPMLCTTPINIKEFVFLR